MRYISTDDGWIALEDRPGHYLHRIGISSKSYNTNTGHSREKIKSATPEEIAHLDACIAAGFYVPWDKNMLEKFYELY